MYYLRFMTTLLHLNLSSMNKVGDCVALLSLRTKFRSLMTAELSRVERSCLPL